MLDLDTLQTLGCQCDRLCKSGPCFCRVGRITLLSASKTVLIVVPGTKSHPAADNEASGPFQGIQTMLKSVAILFPGIRSLFKEPVQCAWRVPHDPEEVYDLLVQVIHCLNMAPFLVKEDGQAARKRLQIYLVFRDEA